MMQGQFMYMGKEKPKRSLCISSQNQLKELKHIHSQTNIKYFLKIFVFKINICPFNSSKYCGSRDTPGESWQTEFQKRVEDEEVKVWRLICCPV